MGDKFRIYCTYKMENFSKDKNISDNDHHLICSQCYVKQYGYATENEI